MTITLTIIFAGILPNLNISSNKYIPAISIPKETILATKKATISLSKTLILKLLELNTNNLFVTKANNTDNTHAIKLAK